MTDQNHKALAKDAWNLYRLASDMLKKINEMFFDEFVDLDLEEQKQCLRGEEKPY